MEENPSPILYDVIFPYTKCVLNQTICPQRLLRSHSGERISGEGISGEGISGEGITGEGKTGEGKLVA